MNFTEALTYLYEALPMFQRLGAAAYRKDLTNTLKLCEYFEQPQQAYPCIHVAGTNGKGSTSHYLASVFQAAGYKTGLYTSPHLRSFTERIRVNGEPVSETFVADFVTQHHLFFKTLDASFFEITVAMAFDYFRAEKVDVAIIETGMGGRLDSTNVITPFLSIITNIGWDHTLFLGATLPEIASEKAGIIKPQVPVVVGAYLPETKEVFEQAALQKNAPLYFAQDMVHVKPLQNEQNNVQTYAVQAPIFKKEQFLKTELLGQYQQKNITTVLAAMYAIQKHTAWKISNEAIVQGIAKVKQQTGLRGRWDVVHTQPLTIADTGHNKEGILEILQQLSAYGFSRVHFVLGFVNDKNIDEMLALFPKTAQYVFTQPQIPRALPLEQLLQAAQRAGLFGVGIATVSDALQYAQEMAQENEVVFVGGSTFVVAEII